MTPKERYRHLKSKGLCVACGKVPPETGRVYCLQCKTCPLHQERRASGLCRSCGAPAVKTKTLCFSCALAHRVKKRGLSRPEVKQALEKFTGCEICGKTTNNKNSEWHLDHNHLTKKFRGILCNNCNTLLGLALEKCEILQKAIAYLRERNPHGNQPSKDNASPSNE